MSENENRQQPKNKHGIDRSRITRAKGFNPVPGMNRPGKPADKEPAGQGAGKKERFKLDLYQKVIAVLTVLVALVYCGVSVLNQKGYMLINTSIQYWLWFAVIICLILFIGRCIMRMPKKPMIQKTAKICVAIISVLFIIMTYMSCLDGINASWQQCAEITSEDGKHSVIVMRIDVDIPQNEEASAAAVTEEAADETGAGENAAEAIASGEETPAEEAPSEETDSEELSGAAAAETEEVPAEEAVVEDATGESAEGKSYTLYSAYPRINSIFCDSGLQDNLIMLENGKDVQLKMEWIDGDLHLYVEEKALEGMESIVVPLD